MGGQQTLASQLGVSLTKTPMLFLPAASFGAPHRLRLPPMIPCVVRAPAAVSAVRSTEPPIGSYAGSLCSST